MSDSMQRSGRLDESCKRMVKWPPGSMRRWEWVAAVQPAVQLWGEAYVGLVYWTGLVEFVRNLYWFQLKNGGLTKEIALVAYLFTPPVVLSHPVWRAHVTLHIWSRPLLLLCGLVGIGGQFFWGPLMRLAFSGTTVGILGIYVIDSLWAVSRARRRRAAFGMIGGILLLQVLRWVNCGLNPLVSRWWGFFLLGVIPGAGTALLLLTEDVFQLEAETWEDEPTDNLDSSSDDDHTDDTEGINLLAVNRPEVDSHDAVDLESNSRLPRELRTLIQEHRESQDSPRSSPRSTPRASPRHVSIDRGGLRDMISSSARMGNHKHVISPLRSDSPLRMSEGLHVIDDGDVRRWKEGEEVPWVKEGYADTDSDVDDETFRQRRWKFKPSVALRTLQIGLGSGCLWFLTHWLFTAPTTMARWLGVSVTWGGPLVICTLGLGMAIAAEAARSMWLKRVHGLLAWIVALVGALMMLWSTPCALTGVVFLVSMLPSMWVMMARNIVGVYPGLGLALSSAIYVGLVLWSTALVAYEFIPGFMAVRGTRGFLLVLSVAGIGLGLGRGPEVANSERRSLGARLGTGRISWGNGVPGRQAIGCLVVAIGIMTVVGLTMRLHPGPAWRGVNPELRVLNFNIQQGFSRSGSVNYDSIYNMLDVERPHITTLQETDTMHIVHGNLDLVDFWATKLKLYSWYAPATKADTWGCAILSTQKLVHGQSQVLPSPHGENACFQQADLQFQGKSIQIMNTHFGVLSSDIKLQAAAIASVVNLTRPLVLSGDFNMAPLTDAYNTTVASGILDSYVVQNGPWKSPGDRDPGAGLVFSSPKLKCVSWKEPYYDQTKTSDGYPIVATFDFV